MAFTLFEGTEAIGATEWSLTTDTSYDTGDAQTTEGVLGGYLDLFDMVAADRVTIRIYEKVRSSDTQRIVEQFVLAGAQGKPIWTFPALPMKHGWDVSFVATTGTVTLNWSLRLIPV